MDSLSHRWVNLSTGNETCGSKFKNMSALFLNLIVSRTHFDHLDCIWLEKRHVHERVSACGNWHRQTICLTPFFEDFCDKWRGASFSIRQYDIIKLEVENPLLIWVGGVLIVSACWENGKFNVRSIIPGNRGNCTSILVNKITFSNILFQLVFLYYELWWESELDKAAACWVVWHWNACCDTDLHRRLFLNSWSTQGICYLICRQLKWCKCRRV